MILDSSLALDPVGSLLTVTRPSINVIDIGTPRDIGVHHRNLYLSAQVSTAIVGPAGTTLQAQWQGSVDNATWNTIVETMAYPAVAIPASRRFLDMEVPRQSPFPDAPGGLFRYFRLNWVVGGGPITAGAVAAFLALEKQDTISYPKNFNISA